MSGVSAATVHELRGQPLCSFVGVSRRPPVGSHGRGPPREDGAGALARPRHYLGLGSVIGIGVTVGSDVQIGALSFVPKHAMLEGGCV